MSEAVYYQFANATRIEKRDAILIAFSTGRRRMEPRSYLRMHHAMACCIAYWYDQGYVHDAPVTYYSRAFYSNEFPTLLAKREIIAIAFVKPQCKLRQHPKATGRLRAKLQKFWGSGGRMGKKSIIPRKQGPAHRPPIPQSPPITCAIQSVVLSLPLPGPLRRFSPRFGAELPLFPLKAGLHRFREQTLD